MSIRGSLIGIELTQNQIIFSYNIPMRNHSMGIIVTYDKKDKQIYMTYKFLGDQSEPRHRRRWDTALRYLYLFVEMNNSIVELIEKSNNQLIFSHGFSIENGNLITQKLVNDLMQISFMYDFPYINLINNLIEESPKKMEALVIELSDNNKTYEGI